MAEELMVVLNRSDTAGLGFSILGTSGLPPIIYDIVENSPAAESGEVEAGDVILKVNETDVNCFSTKEVLKCLRLSADPITLKLKRDPVIKERVQQYLATHGIDEDLSAFVTAEGRTNGSCPAPLLPPPPAPDRFEEGARLAWEPLTAPDKLCRPRPRPPRYEAFMMTGDLILNLSRTQQSSLLPKHSKKVDSLRSNHRHPHRHPHRHTHTHHASVPTSPSEADDAADIAGGEPTRASDNVSHGYQTGFVRSSRSEDPLHGEKDGLSAVDIDIDDCTSSLNTLLDTRPEDPDTPPDATSTDRIVWTYNAPPAAPSPTSSTLSSSPSPTSASSSALWSEAASLPPLSQSEAVSNISSPGYQEDILSGRDLMELSDPSDSDSTLLVSDRDTEHRIVLQVQGPDTGHRRGNDYQELESLDELTQLDNHPTSPPLSEEESDLESLHSFHFHPKAVDLPSAVRLAKRLFAMDGFKKSDVSRHLSKNNEFSRVVADEYLRYFSFEGDSLDIALRKFLKQFSLAGETQERERVLVHFSKRYLDCNPHTFNSQDSVHTLTCAIMLLNTDLHGANIGRKMTCSEFIENLADLNDGANFPRDVLKQLYQAIKSYPLEWALDEEGDECASQAASGKNAAQQCAGSNPFLDVPDPAAAVEHKRGYVMRKSCVDANGKKTALGRRGWKMVHCTLRDMVLYLHKDEHGFRAGNMADNVGNTVRVHHALATKASDYTKKQHVFRLQAARAEYLFQTSDSKELQSWIDTINLVCASYSARPLAGGVGSQRRFQPPLLPCSHTKLNLREQLADHEERVQWLEAELAQHRCHPPDRGSKALQVQNYREKDAYLHYELKRYKTYVYLLKSRVTSETELVPPPVPDRPAPTNRYSYRAAIYSGVEGGADIG